MIDFMRKRKFVAIMRNIDPAFAEKTARALYDGGVRLFEVTFNPSDADTVKKTGSVIEKLNEMFDGTALVGAWMVLTLAVYGDGRDKRHSISEFMKLNPVAVGAGASLVTNGMAKDGRWNEICRNAKRHIEKIRNF